MNPKPELFQKLRHIGFRVGFDGSKASLKKISPLDFDLEDTLIDAMYEGLEDQRVLSLLLAWIKVHGDYVIVEKLFKKLKHELTVRGENKIIQLVTATAVVAKHEKWRKWLKSKSGKAILPLREQTLSASIALKGRDEELFKLGVLVPNGFLQPDESKIFTIQELIQANQQYKNRFLFGPNWRADIIFAIESGVENPFQISKQIGCSYEPAHRISKEYLLVRPRVKKSAA